MQPSFKVSLARKKIKQLIDNSMKELPTVPCLLLKQLLMPDSAPVPIKPLGKKTSLEANSTKRF
jgi:hypothetical protein